MNNHKAEQLIKEIIARFLNPREYKVFIFGSRVTGKASPFSDFDIGVMGKKPVSWKTLGLIEEALEDSDLPFTVDVVDFSQTSQKFQKSALSKTKTLTL